MIPAKTPALVKYFLGSYVWDKPNAQNKIYLTFDDGPIPKVTPWVLDLLKQYNIKATFFCVGENIQKHPEIFNQILNEGHSVGNHTFNHLSGWKATKKTYLVNIKKADDIMQNHGVKTNLFRPPYGKLKSIQSKAIRQLGYNVIMWSILSKDYNQKLEGEKIYENIVQANSGSIIVCHDNIKAFGHLQNILPKAIEFLLDKGFVFSKI